MNSPDALDQALARSLASDDEGAVMFAHAVTQALPARPVGMLVWRRAGVLAAFHAGAAAMAYVLAVSVAPDAMVASLSAAQEVVQRGAERAAGLGGALAAVGACAVLCVVAIGAVAFMRRRAHTATA